MIEEQRKEQRIREKDFSDDFKKEIDEKLKKLRDSKLKYFRHWLECCDEYNDNLHDIYFKIKRDNAFESNRFFTDEYEEEFEKYRGNEYLY